MSGDALPVSTNTHCFSEQSRVVWVGHDPVVFRWWFSINNEPFLYPWTEKCGRGHNEAIAQLEMVTSLHPSQRKGHATFTTQAKKIPMILSHKERVQIPQILSGSAPQYPSLLCVSSSDRKWLFPSQAFKHSASASRTNPNFLLL